MHKCPQNHDSDAPDYCSVCGIEIGAAAPPPPAPPAEASAGACPECSTPRESSRHAFCEVCGYNFRTGTSGIPPAATALVPHETPAARQTVERSPKKTLPAAPDP